MFVAKRMFLTKGVGKHREKLTSFELALRSAGIAAMQFSAGFQHFSSPMQNGSARRRGERIEARASDVCGDQ